MSTRLVNGVMIVRNGERFLASAIDSVLARDYRLRRSQIPECVGP